MRKLLLISILSLVSSNILLTQTLPEIQNWAKNQEGRINAHDVIKYIESTTSNTGIFYGDEYIFHDDTTGYTSSAAMGLDKFVIAFKDVNNNGNGTVVAGLITNDSIIFGSKYVFNSGYSGYFSAIGIDSNRFVVSCCARLGPGSGYFPIKSRVGIVNDTNISLGPVREYGNADHWISSAKLDSDHFILVGRLSATGKAVIGEISGNIITFGGSYEFDPDYNTSYFVAALSPSSFVVVYNDGNYSNDDGVAIIGNINGSTITFGNKYTFCTDNAAYFRVTNLDTNTFVITYPEHNNGDQGTACIGTVNGTVLSFGDKYTFGQVTNFFFHPLRIDAEHFLVTSNNFYDTIAHGSSHIGTVFGDSISYSPSYWFTSMNCKNISSALLDENKILVAFTDYANDTNFYYGRVVIGTYYDNDIETIIDTVNVCSGSFGIPVRVNHLYNASESTVQISYDTLLLTYDGYQNFSTNIPADSLSIDENNGIINIFWHAPTAVNLPSDTVVEVLFSTINVYNQTSTILFFNDTASYYADSIGLVLDSDYFNGQLSVDPIPEPAVFIVGTDSICQGTSNLFYGIASIANADTIIWYLTPDSSGSVIGSDTSVYINFSPSFNGLAVLSAYGVNGCGIGDTAYYNINVIGIAGANAGADTSTCENTNYTMNGSANNYDHIYWATMGDGVFDDPFLLNSTYTLGDGDINNGNVYLILTAFPLYPCLEPVSDTILISILLLPSQPNTPQGPISIDLGTTISSEYFILTVENTISYQWYIEPLEAGIINGIDTSAIVNWNENFIGLVSYIYVEALNECGQTYSDSIIVDISPVELPLHIEYPEITISPNPSKSVFIINTKGSEDYAYVSVINAKGLVIKQAKIKISRNKSVYKLDLSDKSSGIYYIRIVLGSQEITEKVLLRR